MRSPGHKCPTILCKISGHLRSIEGWYAISIRDTGLAHQHNIHYYGNKSEFTFMQLLIGRRSETVSGRDRESAHGVGRATDIDVVVADLCG